MTANRFAQILQTSSYSENDRKYFPKWVRSFLELPDSMDSSGNCVVSEPLTIRFCRKLRDGHAPAWQRLQAVRALEAEVR